MNNFDQTYPYATLTDATLTDNIYETRYAVLDPSIVWIDEFQPLTLDNVNFIREQQGQWLYEWKECPQYSNREWDDDENE